MARKTLVHKRDVTETVSVAGTLLIGEDKIEVLGVSGERVDLLSIIEKFNGEDIVLAMKLQEKEEIEVVE